MIGKPVSHRTAVRLSGSRRSDAPQIANGRDPCVRRWTGASRDGVCLPLAPRTSPTDTGVLEHRILALGVAQQAELNLLLIVPKRFTPLLPIDRLRSLECEPPALARARLVPVEKHSADDLCPPTGDGTGVRWSACGIVASPAQARAR